MFIQKIQSENQNLSDTLAFQICSFSASSYHKIISDSHPTYDPFHSIHPYSISFHTPFHFIHPYLIHFIPWSTSFPSQIFKIDFFLQLNNTDHKLQVTFHTSLHFIIVIHFIPLFTSLILHYTIFYYPFLTHFIQHSIHASNHSIPCFKTSTGTFYNQSEILQLVRHSVARDPEGTIQ